MYSPRRALPMPPTMPGEGYYRQDPLDGSLGLQLNPYESAYPYPSPFAPRAPNTYDDQPSTLRGGTILHKGFYDLLALIPATPSPSRFLWPTRTNPAQDQEPVAGPRYEEIPSGNLPQPASPQPNPGPTSPKRGRRISKDMVSKPTGFV